MNNIEIMPSNTKDVEVLHKTGNNGEHFLMHVHSNYEIYLSLSDNNKFFVGHKIYEVNKYDVFLFNNADVHKINASSPYDYERYVVNFSLKIFSKADAEIGELLICFDKARPNRNHKISLPREQAEEFLSVLKKMLATGEEAAHRSLKLRTYLIELLLIVNDMQKAAPREQSAEGEDKRINEIMEYIRANCNYPISLDMLSEKFYLNKYYLCRMFKAKMGFGISDYIESCRLSNAIPLLREGVPVSTVALKTGFGSDTYFISTFKKNLGTSPKQYIKKV